MRTALFLTNQQTDLLVKAIKATSLDQAEKNKIIWAIAEKEREAILTANRNSAVVDYWVTIDVEPLVAQELRQLFPPM